MERYTKVRNIGKGNMGTAFLAKDNEDGRFYVIKQVDLAKLNKKERQQSLNEAKVLSALRHPNIINYVDSFLAKKTDHLCIVMEFADGGDLCNKVKYQRGVRFSEEQVLDWFIQIVLSLQHMHRRKILHRDVKTQNIFLTTDNLCKLGDFGISKALSGTYEQTNTFVGTPYYLSPELILERPYDHMSDVWALGIVLYELMALRHPFNANDMKSLMHRILRVQYDPPPLAYSDGLRSIVGKILTKDPNQRIRLNEILELPVVHNRMRLWVSGGIMPPKYVASLVRNKLFPNSIMALVGPSVSSLTGTPTSAKLNTTETALPMIGGGAALMGLAAGGAEQKGAGGMGNNQMPSNDDSNKRQLVPKPPLQGLPTRQQQGGGVGLTEANKRAQAFNNNNYAPLGGIANIGHQQQPQPLNRAPYATPYMASPNPRPAHLPPVGQMAGAGAAGYPPPSNARYGAGAVQASSALGGGGALPNIRGQPSARPLPGNPYAPNPPQHGAYSPPSSLPTPTPTTEIQSMLVKAAQDRIALRNGRRW